MGGLKTQQAFAKRVLASCRGAFRGARETHRTPPRYGSTRSRVQGLRAAFTKLHCAISGRHIGGHLFWDQCVFWGAEMRFAGAEKCIFVFPEGRKQNLDGIEIAIVPAVVSKLWASESPTFGRHGQGVPGVGSTPASLNAVRLWGWALQSRLSLVWQGLGTESHGSLWALGTPGSRAAVDRTRVRRICWFWKHCLHRAFSLARRRSAFSEPWQTHLLWERCVSLGTCRNAFCVAEIPPPRRFLCPPPLPSTP